MHGSWRPSVRRPTRPIICLLELAASLQSACQVTLPGALICHRLTSSALPLHCHAVPRHSTLHPLFSISPSLPPPLRFSLPPFLSLFTFLFPFIFSSHNKLHFFFSLFLVFLSLYAVVFCFSLLSKCPLLSFSPSLSLCLSHSTIFPSYYMLLFFLFLSLLYYLQQLFVLISIPSPFSALLFLLFFLSLCFHSTIFFCDKLPIVLFHKLYLSLNIYCNFFVFS